jgi:cardiolipin synthase A/B
MAVGGALVNKRWPGALVVALGARYAMDSLRHRRERGQGYSLRGDEIDVGSEAFLAATEAITSAPIAVGNSIELFINGDEIFPAMLETIASARRSVNLVTYVYWPSEIGRTVAAALCERARAGVAVNVLLDAIGCSSIEPGVVRDMEDAGITFAHFRPLKPYAVRRLNNRTHRKLLVTDGEVGMTGGVGIADQWTGSAQDPDHWRDTHVRVRGPIVRGLQGAFAENWLEATGNVLVGSEYLPDLAPMPDGMAMQVVRSSASVGDTNVEALFYLAIASARSSLNMTTAYFAPRPAFIEALSAAARRGVNVRLLVPGPNIDKDFVRQAGRAVYEQLLRVGVRIYEYQPTMLHAKTFTIDGVWSTVGSVNFDNRSFQLQDECSLCVHSSPFAALLDEHFECDVVRSVEIDPERWNDRPRRTRVTEALTKLARREL